MLLQFVRFSRTACRKFLEVLRDSGKKHAWLAEARKTSRVHESIEFIGLEPTVDSVRIGRGCNIERDISIWLSNDAGADARLELASPVYLGRNVYLGCYQPITIGNDVMIGAYSYLTSGDHRFDRRDIPMHLQGFKGGPIEIGSDVWIGTHVTILPDVKIGQGAIIGAGSVVTKSVPPFEIWAGVPARFIRQRPV